MKKLIFSCLLVLLPVSFINAQTAKPKNEARGAWIATVINLDWPSSTSVPVSFQKNELTNRLRQLKKAGINLVYFQVRSEGDAMYESEIEPWSAYLTGSEGTAPSPLWDPLAYAIEEAHSLGLELHAWLNPYRAMRSIPSDFTQKVDRENVVDEAIDESLAPFLDKEFDANSSNKFKGTEQRDSLHVSNQHPEWLMVLNNKIAIFDPGLPEVIDYTTNIVLDIVNRYDVDGIHFDDYFYPYPPNHMGSSSQNETLDDSTFIKYPRGFSDKGAWRRNNIDILVEQIYDSIQVVKPWVKFGISPFGIWKSGTPSGIVGLNAYTTIYGDAISWLESGTVDYIVPQLYWAFGGGQDYARLATWWADRATENNRHFYPGHGLYRSDSNTYSNTLFAANEIPRQIAYNQEREKIKGSVFFRMKNITNYNSKGIVDSLQNNYYKYVALPPIMEWKSMTKPDSPENLIVTRDSENEYIFDVSWSSASADQISKISSTGHVDSLIKYAVYRVDSGADPDESAEMDNYYNLIEVTGDTSYTDIAPPSENGYWYFVTAVSRNNIESAPTPSAEGGVVVSNDEEPQLINEFQLAQNYPNPFNPSTEISFNLAETGFTSLKVYDMLGRQVSALVNENRSSGLHTVSFDASNLASGIYIYRLTSKNSSLTRRMTLIK